jgi:hypothetical protein
VIRYGQYGRKASWILKRNEKYERKAIWIVKRYGKCGRRKVELWNDMENMEEK